MTARWPHGDRLRRLLRDRGTTPQALAAAAGVGVNTVYSLLAGATSPMDATLAPILGALAASRDDLLAAEPLAPADDRLRWKHRPREISPIR